MRSLALASFLFAAACSESAAPPEKNKSGEATATELAAGQWETTRQITKVTPRDGGTPVLQVGETKTSQCVGAGEGRKPAPPVLTGLQGAECNYDNIYMSRGRITASVSCMSSELGGRVMVSSEGTFKADSFETNGDIQTSLASDGDVQAIAKITGRRVGECTATAPAKG